MPMVKTQSGAYYKYVYITTFEETNLVGNIYFANYVLWQGKCREMFLNEYCPEVIKEIGNGLSLITLDLSVQYVSQLFAFDEVIIKMYLEAQSTSRLLMVFEYFKKDEAGNEILVCKGTQSTGAMREVKGKMVAVPFPDSMMELFERYEISTL